MAISAWTAGQRGKSAGQELSPVEEKEYAALIRAAKDCELAACGKLDSFTPVEEGARPEAVADARWAIS